MYLLQVGTQLHQLPIVSRSECLTEKFIPSFICGRVHCTATDSLQRSSIVSAQPIGIFLHKSICPSLSHTFLRKLVAQPCPTDCINMFFQPSMAQRKPS